jgi:hypothetical protein
MLTNAMRKTQVLFIGLSLTSAVMAVEKPKSVLVAGWPLDIQNPTGPLLAGDPLLGPLLCPSLTRLNLANQRSEFVLLKQLEDKGNRWSFQPKSGLSWWDGSTVDLESFLRAELPKAIETQGLGQWKVPAFSFRKEGETLHLEWKEAPAFGPYILNRMPLIKEAAFGRLAFQCAGAYRPQYQAAGIELQSTASPAAPVLQWVDVDQQAVRGQEMLRFRFGEELHPEGYRRQLEDALECPRKVDTPLISLIAWNPTGRWTKDVRFRRAMTHLLPRGALLRSGAGSLGDLLSGPILRIHPGYRRSLLVPTYDPSRADHLLNELGHKRSEEDGYRRTDKGQIMEVQLLVSSADNHSLVRKVIDDSFRVMGLKVAFVTQKDKNPDGMLTSLVSPWPDTNLMPFLHSKSKSSPWPWTYQDNALDQGLEAYALSLTRQQPDFTLLEKVHELVYKQEPFSILMQHKVCLDSSRGIASTRLSLRNPDWFAELVGARGGQ